MTPTYRTSFATGERPPQSHHVAFKPKIGVRYALSRVLWFDLHFLAYTDETLPNPDVTAVENREWLWKRPYTTLEFQQIPGVEIQESPAFQGLEITG